MKIGFALTPAICVYGDGEVNSVSKKIYLKKNLKYVEPEVVEEETMDEIYDPTKDPNYQHQKRIEADIILSGFPYLLEQPRAIITKLCQLLNFPADVIRYYYSFETVSRRTGERKFHLIISNKTAERKICIMERLDLYGILCFQDLNKTILRDENITIITHETRYTSFNYAIKKELMQMIIDGLIVDYKYENHQFHAKLSEEEDWIVVNSKDVLNLIKNPIPDMPDEPEEIDIWGDDSGFESLEDKLNALKQNFESKTSDEDWVSSFRRPSQIQLEPLEMQVAIFKASRQPLFQFKSDSIDEEDPNAVKTENIETQCEPEPIKPKPKRARRIKKFKLVNNEILERLDTFTAKNQMKADAANESPELAKPIEENIENPETLNDQVHETINDDCTRKLSVTSYDAITLGLNIDEIF